MRILAADDDLVSRLAMEDVLRQCGTPEIVLAEDGACAWRQMAGDAHRVLDVGLARPAPDGAGMGAAGKGEGLVDQF